MTTALRLKADAYALGKGSQFRHLVESAPGVRFAPEAGRLRLYVVIACPWAHRTLIAHALKGLERAVPVVELHHRMDEDVGWAFPPGRPDALYGHTHLIELYRQADPSFEGRPTVPMLWDTREETIVSNDSADIMRMFGSAFDALAERPEIDLHPPPLRAAIDAWNARLHDAVNIGVYRAGFARSDSERDAAVQRLFETLGMLDAHLATHRFLVGNAPTEADWRLLPTLLRLAWVYHDLFGCNRRRLDDYPHLLGYTRELAQWPGIAKTFDEARTREAYFTSMKRLNPAGTLPPGLGIDFAAPHGRG